MLILVHIKWAINSFNRWEQVNMHFVSYTVYLPLGLIELLAINFKKNQHFYVFSFWISWWNAYQHFTPLCVPAETTVKYPKIPKWNEFDDTKGAFEEITALMGEPIIMIKYYENKIKK